MATLTVGQGEQYATIAAAVNASASGDTINVDAGDYNNDFFYIGHSLTLQAVGGEARILGNQSGAFGKAAIVEGVAGANVVINGFDISGVAVGDGNGAAIRYEGGNLSLTDDYFHNNQEGLLGNGDDPNGTIAVHHSEFAFNGDGSGFTHNFYAGAIANVTIDDSYFHDANVGHEIKSRAANTTVTNSRVFDNNSTASYSIDTPNGGNVLIQHNIIEQGPNSENNAIFAWGEEGASQGGSDKIDSNTIVNDRDGGRALVGGPVAFTNNQDWNLPLGGSNVDLTARPSLDTSSLSFIGAPTPTPTPTPPPPPPPEPTPPPPVVAPPPDVAPPPPTLSLADWYGQIAQEFIGYSHAHPDVFASPTAIGALITELTSPTILQTPIPGDLWS